jgi:ATP-dependent helicase HrpA
VDNLETERPSDRIERLLPDCLYRDRVRIQSQLEQVIEARIPGPAKGRRFKQLFEQVEKSAHRRATRLARRPLVSYPEELPITSKRDEIVAAIEAHSVVIVVGETGSGKTTQLPKMCLDALRGIDGLIGCSQPRRVAAQSVSRRVAEELEVTFGREVGCKVRFNDETSRDGYVKFMTDGMLLAEMQGDSLLKDYDTLVIDEAHERSLNIDFILGYLKGLVGRRPDLKVVITSATIDAEAFSKAFGGAPIVEVSGRLYPVEVMYVPPEHLADDEEGEIHYVEAAVRATETVIDDPHGGDILIFMPGERDIRETRDLLEGRFGQRAEIVPLFGRLSSSEQQRVFARGNRRKIVIATNIAETSLTIPGIRYVIDSGVARISRYNPKTRTKRLPIEPVAQSSANQRMGRAGRLADGICIRLYTEEDFEERPRFMQPEIQRCNLAEVILRMKAFHLGDIDTFPFINPPNPKAIAGGYQLLQELGALDDQREITDLGNELARLQVDPTIGRMALQAREEGCLTEVIVIASGLSIQDPRDRPADTAADADRAHRQFFVPDSDYLTLLRIWEVFHEQRKRLKTQGQLRKWCHKNYLSYLRMREWREIHSQLEDSLDDKRGGGSRTGKDLDYQGIHRSILSGVLAHVALKEKTNFYKTAGNREAMIFPSSGLFDRNRQSGGRKKNEANAEGKLNQPKWVVAGEVVETSRLFLRMVAKIQPEWVFDIGEHVCKFSHKDPHWDVKSGRVLVKERVSINGLDLLNRRIPFGRVNPEMATEIFVREALIGDGLDSRHAFVETNRRLVQKLETCMGRIRGSGHLRITDQVYEFYITRLVGVSSVPELDRLIKSQCEENPDFLILRQEDLLGDQAEQFSEGNFPDEVTLSSDSLPLTYRYSPGEQDDGVTLKVPLKQVPAIAPGALDWVVPGYREEQVRNFLWGLPKGVRKQLMPLEEKVAEIVRELRPNAESLATNIRHLIEQKFGVRIAGEQMSEHSIPDFLRTRVEVVTPKGEVLYKGRDLATFAGSLKKRESQVNESVWEIAVARFERHGVKSWDFGDLAERVELTEFGGLPLFGYPGLTCESGEVSVRVFKTVAEAEAATPAGWFAICSFAMVRELGWLEAELHDLDQLEDLYRSWGSADDLKHTAMVHLKRFLFGQSQYLPLREAGFNKKIEKARELQRGLSHRFTVQLKGILHLGMELLRHPTPYPGMQEEVFSLMPRSFLLHVPHHRLAALFRYLQRIKVRAERARVNPVKDNEKAKRIAEFDGVWVKYLKACPPANVVLRSKIDELRWQIEEFKVSIFAQELGTEGTVSAKRLSNLMGEIAAEIT